VLQAHSSSEWRPKVTALVPCYNSSAFISRTLDSLAAQTWPNLEILVGDDASADDTLSIVEAFATGRANVRILRREQNLGWLRNSNDLMSHATGELMFFGFHDDVPEPTYVEKLVGALRDNPSAVLAFCDYDLFHADGHQERVSFSLLEDRHSALSRGAVMAGRPTFWSAPNRGMFRSWAFARAGGIKPHEAGEFSADWTWLLLLSTYGDFVRVPEVLHRKYYQKTSLSRNWAFSRVQWRALRKSAFREILGSDLHPVTRILLAAYIGLNLHAHMHRLHKVFGRL
jgi:glycosyltransferase involved in cell wall biosynthesis